MKSRDTWMGDRGSTFLLAAVLTVAWAASFAALPFAPERYPIHFGTNGEVDSYASRWFGLFLMPAIITLVTVLYNLQPRIDPRRANYAAFPGTFRLMRLAIVIVLTGIHLATIAVALGWDIRIDRVVPLMVGVLFTILGNVLGKTRPNWFIGIRTPWTLSSDDVWTRTHRFVGRLMVVAGLLMVGTSLLLPSATLYVVVVTAALIAVGSFAYSYWVWRQLGGRKA